MTLHFYFFPTLPPIIHRALYSTALARPEEMVPFTWHSAAVEMWHEFKHCYNIDGWWDLTASDDVLPVQAHAMEMRHPSPLASSSACA